MNKILVCVEDSLLSIRIKRFLTEKRFVTEITKNPIKTEELNKYDIVIIHSSYRIANLFGFIENLVLKNIVPVIYLSMNPHVGLIQRLNQYANFTIIDEIKMDAELPLAVVLHGKFVQKTKILEAENKKLKVKSQNEKTLLGCKNYLITTGLSEDEAHHKIIKLAMDNKINKYQMADRILKEKL